MVLYLDSKRKDEAKITFDKQQEGSTKVRVSNQDSKRALNLNLLVKYLYKTLLILVISLVAIWIIYEMYNLILWLQIVSW